VPQQAIKNVGRAYQRFFQKQAKFPRFKKRGVHDAARLDNEPGTFQCEGTRIRWPKIGWVRMRETLRFDGKLLSAILSWEADRWFISIPVDIDRPEPGCESPATVGIDLDVSPAVTLSTGEKIDSPKPLKKHLGNSQKIVPYLSKPGHGKTRKNTEDSFFPCLPGLSVARSSSAVKAMIPVDHWRIFIASCLRT